MNIEACCPSVHLEVYLGAVTLNVSCIISSVLRFGIYQGLDQRGIISYETLWDILLQENNQCPGGVM